MKTISEPAVLNPSILLLAAAAVVIIFIALNGAKIPYLSNIKVDLALLIVIGMTICSQGGIGRVAATGQWTHPLAIIGYFLGVCILILAVGVFFNLKLPFIASQQQAFILISLLIGAKFINAIAHYLINRV